MIVRQSIEAKLTQAYAPTKLVVHDDSGRHAGHAGHRPGQETHFNVECVSDAFSGKSRLERHRMVMTLLDDEIKGGVHALQLTLRTPAEV